MNIYDVRKYGTVAFLLISVAVVAVFLYFSTRIVKDLSNQERSRMQIWADATKEIANLGSDPDNIPSDNYIDFLLGIIEANNNIPVLLTDNDGNIITHRNFDLPEPIDSLQPLYISDANAEFLNRKLSELRGSENIIPVKIDADNLQYLYYEDSKLLKELSYFPYIQLLVMIAFVIIVYFAVTSSKKAEQNKVWVGLSKETAHQLGTPISSLMAWIELMESMDVDADIVKEMNKDVQRLSTIASRFSKIGSRPQMEPEELQAVVRRCVEYMSSRISSQVDLTLKCTSESLMVNISSPLIEWVMENLIKNAVDAMEGDGSIEVEVGKEREMAVIEVSDTGKGMSRKHFKTVFNPGFTTKKRGWGLGLTLAKRIIEQYHLGKIFVKQSEPGVGTVFRIELPLLQNETLRN